MSFLLDTDTCSAHLKRPAGLMHRFIQYAGRLHVPTIVLGELYAWVHIRPNPTKKINLIHKDLLPNVVLLDFNSDCAQEFGRLRGFLQKSGITVGPLDILIASVALVHNLTLVTHNTADFQNIPNLRLDDWLIP
jgi:tRNA(fMet)-specific endonuclease VapC